MMDHTAVFQLLNKNYPVTFTNMEFHREGGSLSYVVSGEDRRYFLRKIRSAFAESTRQSLDPHRYLIENNVSVPKIIFTKGSAPCVEAADSDGKHLYILYEFIEGQEPDRMRDAEKIGDLVGRYHQVMQGYDGELAVRGKYDFIDKYIEILRKKEYPENKIRAFKKHGDRLWEQVKDLDRGYCHSDLYIGNIHKSMTGELFILDLDRSCYGFPLYDVALVCNATDYFKFDEAGFHKTNMILDRFLSGYEQFFTISEVERKAVFYFIAIYHYQLQAIIIEKNGLDCVDEEFLDNQLDWLMKWDKQCAVSFNPL